MCPGALKLGNEDVFLQKYLFMQGSIALENMEFYAGHGHFPEEKLTGNRFVVSLHLDTDITAAAGSDNLIDALDYQKVYRAVAREMQHHSHLLEHLCHRIGTALMLEFPAILALRLCVSKVNPPLGGKIERVSLSVQFNRSN